jgi:amphi-Trp domain-containing protein
MPEETLFKSETRMEKADVADYLRTVADKLDAGDDLVLSAGEQSTTLAVPGRPTFEVKVERESPRGGGPGELSLELELEWSEADGEETGLSIE